MESEQADSANKEPPQDQQRPEKPLCWREKNPELKAIFESRVDDKPVFIAEELQAYRQRWLKISTAEPGLLQSLVDEFVSEIKQELARRVSSTPGEKAFVEEFAGTVEATTIAEQEVRDTGPAVGEEGQQGLGYY